MMKNATEYFIMVLIIKNLESHKILRIVNYTQTTMENQWGHFNGEGDIIIFLHECLLQCLGLSAVKIVVNSI